MAKYNPTHLTLWTHPQFYSGKAWEGWYPVLSRTRDSDTLTRSNYRVALKRLQEIAGGATCYEGKDEEPTVTDARAKHSAYGWVETIYVWAGDEEAVRAADEIIAGLESYPVVCEHDWAQLESEEAETYWESMSLRDRVEACVRFDVSPFAARRDKVPEDPRGELVSYLADGC